MGQPPKAHTQRAWCSSKSILFLKRKVGKFCNEIRTNKSHKMDDTNQSRIFNLFRQFLKEENVLNLKYI